MDGFFRAAVCELDKLLDDFEQSEDEPGRAASEVTSCCPASSDPSGRHFAPLIPHDVSPPATAVESAAESERVASPSELEALGPHQRRVEEAMIQNCGNADGKDLEHDCGAELDHKGAPSSNDFGILSSGPPWDPPASVVGPAESEGGGAVGEDESRLVDAVSPMFQVQRTFSVDDAVSHITCRGPVFDSYWGVSSPLSFTLPQVASLSLAVTAPTFPENLKDGLCLDSEEPRPCPQAPPDSPESERAPAAVTDEELDAFLRERGERESGSMGRPPETHADEGFSEMNGDPEGGPDPLGYEGEGSERRAAGGSRGRGASLALGTETATDDEDSYFSSPSLEPSPCEADVAGRGVYAETLEADHSPHFGATRPQRFRFGPSPRTPEAEERSKKTHPPPSGEISANRIHASPPVPLVGEDIPSLPVIGSGHTHENTYENICGCSELSEAPPSPSSSHCTREDSTPPGEEATGRRGLGAMQPSWVPDSHAPSCMHCLQRFTFTKRRHHCRACGKVYCAICCNRKCQLEYLERNARVCLSCYGVIHRERGPSSDPNVPPLPQARASRNHSSAPPTVMVPVSALKHPSNEAFPREQRRVWFADGLLPTGEVADTTRLSAGAKRSAVDSAATEPPVVKGKLGAQAEVLLENGSSGRPEEAVESPEAVERPPVSGPWDYNLLCRVAGCVERGSCLLPEEEEGLPPLLIITEEEQGGDVLIQEHPSPSQILLLLEEGGPQPLTFVLNANLLVNVKLVTYCDRKCWCFSSNGLRGLGQQELVFIIQGLPEEGAVPKDIFSLYIRVYQEAQRGRFVEDLGSVTLVDSFLGNREHGGFLFFSPTHQPLGGLSLPPPPFLCGVLIHKLEVPWAKVFPLRLQLRLGAEYSVYPSPLVSVRSRKPVYRETGHTIMNLLTDLRNFQYSLPVVDGLQVHMEMGNSYILIPKARYTQILKVVNSSNEHVISVGASFSREADSHLVCFQNEDGNYQTQANGMLGKTRTVTGASFLVFNGALKASSGFIARSTIVEDGLMVQITPDTMEDLRQALGEQRDFQIRCGKADSMETQENINIRWVDRPLLTDAGVTSPVDGRSLAETLRVRMEQDTDFRNDGMTIKCTEVFYLPKAPGCPVSAAPSPFRLLQQDIARATCAALCPNLTNLKERGINCLGLRVSSDTDMVEYQAGSGGRVLPQRYMNDLDGALIPLIHGGASSIPAQPTDMELLFYISQTP